MTMLDRMEANLEAAARQRAGRVTREECVEAMAKAIKPEWFCESGALLRNYDGQDLKYQNYARNQASAALDAALASGYVIRP